MSKQANPYIKQYLMTAGPTPLPPEVSLAMAEPIVYHRAPVFLELYERVLRRLKYVFQTENEVLVFSSSGSGGMESAAANLVSPGLSVLVASCGKFGERWNDLCAAFGADIEHLQFEWGTKVDPEEVDKALAGAAGKIRAVFTTQSETSTGVVNDVKRLAEVCRSHDAVLCVDAVSGMGAVDLPTDEWEVGVVVSGSQKALMAPPGLGFVAVGERALALAAEHSDGRFYFDWQKTLKGQQKSPAATPFTPAVSLIKGLDAALELIERETLAKVFERHALLGKATRSAAKGIGLELFGPSDNNANAVTAVRVPDGVDGAELVKFIRTDLGVTMAGGQEQLKGKIVRIAHCGYYGAFDVVTAISALELGLSECGFEFELGAGVSGAQQVFAQAGLSVR